MAQDPRNPTEPLPTEPDPRRENRSDFPTIAEPPAVRELSSSSGELAESRFPPGQVLNGRYRIVSLLGRGGMGEVYRADDLKLGGAVALKFLPEPMEHDEAKMSRFLDEVKLARQISHPNVCRVHDVSEVDGHPFLSMEYIDGEDLASLLRRIGRLPRAKAFEIGGQLCAGLAAVHEQGVLHLDLKPTNLMIDGRGETRITDFGIAGLTEIIAGTEVRFGTPAFMAPEQHTGGGVSAQSDLYALGLVLYELFTGHRAFTAKAWVDLAQAHLETRPEAPSSLVTDLDLAVERVILQCLEKRPGDRPASARVVAAVLADSGGVLGWRPAARQAIPHRPHWVLKHQLGAGGFGEVWLAQHRKTRDQRVFKFCFDAGRLPALQREITVFRLLREELGDRDDVVRILDWNFDEAPYYLESEYTEGGNLEDWAGQQGGIAAVDIATRLEIVAQVATALAAAHSVGVLHKDVKPSNVLITGGTDGAVRAQLTDFGVGAVTDRRRLDDAGITMLGWAGEDDETTAGTRIYLAPELVEGKTATVQADVYALGVLLYQLVVGDLKRVLAPGWRRDVTDELLRDDIAAAVDGLPERRLGDARELAARLRSVDARRQDLRAERRRQAALDRAHRRRRLLATVAAVLAVFAVSMGILAGRIAREKGRAENAAAKAQNLLRIAAAGEWLAKDPTKAALVLLEVEQPEKLSYAVPSMHQVLTRQLAALEMRGHDGPISSGRWSPDGTRVVTASGDGTARVWDLASGAVTVLHHQDAVVDAAFDAGGERVISVSKAGALRSWHGGGTGESRVLGSPAPDEPRDPIRSVAWSPSADRVATVSEHGSVRLWAVDAPGPGIVLDHPEGGALTAVFSPRGDLVATGSADGIARVWRADGSGPPTVLRGGDSGGVVAAFSPDGTRIATASWDGSLRVWNADGSGTAVDLEVPLELEPFLDVVWDPSGSRIAISSLGAAWVLNADGSGRPIELEGYPWWPVDAAFSPDGSRVLTASRDGTVRSWNADGNGEPLVFRGHSGEVAAAFSPDGRRILTASGDGTARIWELAGAGEPLVFAGHVGAVTGIFSPDGERFLTASWDGSVRVWPALGGTTSVVLEGHRGAITAASFSADGKRVVTASADATARVWRADGSGDAIVLSGHRSALSAASFDPGGGRVLTASADATARVWNADGSGEPVVLAGHLGAITSASFSADGRRVVTAAADGSARVWRADGWGSPVVLEGHRAAVTSAAFGPGGEQVVTASADGDVRIWNADGAGKPQVLAGHQGPISSAASSPDGKRVVTVSGDGTARLWQVADARAAAVLRGHHRGYDFAFFSPDGSRIGTVSRDGWAEVWRADGSGEPIVIRDQQGISSLAFSPTGDRALTVAKDGTARIWRLEARDLVQVLRSTTRVCLDPDFRTRVLGEEPAAALQRYESCAAPTP